MDWKKFSVYKRIIDIFVGFSLAVIFTFGAVNYPSLQFKKCFGSLTDCKPSAKTQYHVKILCWVMTGPTFKNRSSSVKETWGKRCDRLLFMSSEEDQNLPAIKLQNVSEGRRELWAKTREAFRYVYKHYYEDYQWFLKTDDDTFIIMENLKHFLHAYDHKKPYIFGSRFKQKSVNYMSGGAGYLLSQESLLRFVTKGLEENRCPLTKRSEDLAMGRCLGNLGSIFGNDTDKLGRHRFLALNPKMLLNPGYLARAVKWYTAILVIPQEDGINCCSNETISFHYIYPELMRLLDFLVYHMEVYNIQNVEESLDK